MNWNSCLYHSKTLLVKQGTFLFECWPDSVEKGDILITGDLDISEIEQSETEYSPQCSVCD